MSNTVRIIVRKENLIMIMEIGIWITFIIINAVIEAFSMGVTNLWLACGGVIGLVLAAAGVPFMIQIIATLLVSILLLIFLREKVRTKFNNTIHSLNVADGTIGKLAIAEKDFGDHEGVVVIDHMEWKAKSDRNHKKGDKLIVTELSGVTVTVIPYENTLKPL